jgi:ATP-dependent Lhr-like helicase
MALLERYGILIRGAAAAERVAGGFGALYPVLRALEDGGQCRRGYFVEGLGAAQFALPGAVDRMRAMADSARAAADSPRAAPGSAGPWDIADGSPRDPWDTGGPGARAASNLWDTGGPGPLAEGGPGDTRGRVRDRWDVRSAGARGQDQARIVVLAAADPANAYGAALPWPERPGDGATGHRPGRKAGALVVLAGGDLVLYVERGGKTLLSWTSEPTLLEPATAALAAAVRAGALGRLTVERADGGGVYDSPLARALESAGFRPTPRGLRLRG